MPRPFLSTLHATVVAVLLLIAPAALQAQEKQPPEVTKTVEGTITLVQKDTKQFVLRTSDGKEMILAMDDATNVKSEGREARWSDLTVGTVANVTFIPKGGQFLTLNVHGIRQAGVLRPEKTVEGDTKPGDTKPGVQPITVKGKIVKVESDLSALTLKTFDDKELSFQIEEELRYRLKNSKTSVPSLAAGTEVAAVYVIEEGKNKLVVIRDVVQTKEPPPSQPPTQPPPSRAIPGTSSTTKVNQGVAVVGQLPVVPGPLPAGFVATTNTPLGALQGFVVQVRGDMAIVSNTIGPVVREGAQPPAGQPPVGREGDQPPPTQPPVVREGARPPAGAGQDKGFLPKPDPQPKKPGPDGGDTRTPIPPGGDPAAAGAREFFVLLGMNSKEPFLIDQQTRVAANNQNLRLADLREGSEIQATFEVLQDGTRRVALITVLRAPAGGANAAPGQNPPQDPAARPGVNAPGNAGNVLVGRIARLKGDVIFLQGGQGEFAVLMAFNSLEPLRMDDATRFKINDREARFSDLQVGMKANVFVELVNNVRRVIGVAATQAAARP